MLSGLKSTLSQYENQANKCRDLFVKKMSDYGTSWRVLRLSSVVDQLYIKAKRIRTLEEGVEAKIADSIWSEYVGIVNYSLMALIQLELGDSELEGQEERVVERYDFYFKTAKELMVAKNNDYGEAWRLMQRSSLTDLVLVKILRVKQIVANSGKTLVSEGLDANFLDMVNYGIFAMIKMDEEKELQI